MLALITRYGLKSDGCERGRELHRLSSSSSSSFPLFYIVSSYHDRFLRSISSFVETDDEDYYYYFEE